MKYLKIDDKRIFLSEEGGSFNGEELIIKIINKNYDFDEIKRTLSNLDKISIYSCIVQDDGRETDEYIMQEFDRATKLISIKYEMTSDLYILTFVEPNETEDRIAELEDALNFLLMGGEE